MEKQYDNANRGVLFSNDPSRKTNPKAPDFSGNVTLSPELIRFAMHEIASGREPTLSLAGWTKQGRRGKFVSLSVSEPYKKTAAAPAPQPREEIPDDDDLPF